MKKKLQAKISIKKMMNKRKIDRRVIDKKIINKKNTGTKIKNMKTTGKKISYKRVKKPASKNVVHLSSKKILNFTNKKTIPSKLNPQAVPKNNDQTSNINAAPQKLPGPESSPDLLNTQKDASAIPKEHADLLQMPVLDTKSIDELYTETPADAAAKTSAENNVPVGMPPEIPSIEKNIDKNIASIQPPSIINDVPKVDAADIKPNNKSVHDENDKHETSSNPKVMSEIKANDKPWAFMDIFKPKAQKPNESTVKNLLSTKNYAKKRIASRFLLRDALRKAGYENIDVKNYKNNVLYLTIFLVIILSIVLLIHSIMNYSILSAIFLLITLWILGFPLLLLLSWVSIYLFLDYMKYRRRVELEEVWPDYLQLVVSNINAGMLIDVALWSAVKPKFKVLAKEIEEVAKQTLTGVDLSIALREFSDKYDSPMLKRTISLLIEGLDSGGQIAVLLSKIAVDIQNTKIMKKEMSASVTTYAIFISFATIVAAPFLFGLSTELLIIVQKIVGSVSQNAGSTGLMSFRADSIKISDFKIFAYVMLSITSFMSACIIGTIRRGSVKDGLKYIPFFIAGTLLIYLIASSLLGTLMGQLI